MILFHDSEEWKFVKCVVAKLLGRQLKATCSIRSRSHLGCVRIFDPSNTFGPVIASARSDVLLRFSQEMN